MSRYKSIKEIKLEESYLVVGWNKDTGKISQKVVEFLNNAFSSELIGELEQKDFFSFSGVSVEDDIAQFPFSNFYYIRDKNLILFLSDQPDYKPYEFLNLVLDVSEKYFSVKEIYTVNGLLSLSPHTSVRKIYTVFNDRDFLDRLRGYDIELLTWEGTPAISSYLLWLAKERGIPGMSLWTGIPFYLAPIEDYESLKVTIEFFDKRFNLNLKFDSLNELIIKQNEKIRWLRDTDEEINDYITQIENGQELDEERQLKLIKDVYEIFRGRVAL